MKDVKKEWWKDIARRYGNDPKKLNAVDHLYDGSNLLISNQPFAWEEALIRQGVTFNDGEKTFTIKFTDIVDWERCKQFLNTRSDKKSVFPKVIFT